MPQLGIVPVALGLAIAYGGSAAAQVPRSATPGGLDLNGKPCVKLQGTSRRHTINPKLFDHIVVADNHCAQLVKLRICYSNSDQCVLVDVPSYGRKEAVL